VRNSPVSTKVRAGGGEEVLKVPEQRLPCSPWRDHSGAGYFLAAHGEGHSGVNTHTAACGGPDARTRAYFLKEL